MDRYRFLVIISQHPYILLQILIHTCLTDSRLTDRRAQKFSFIHKYMQPSTVVHFYAHSTYAMGVLAMAIPSVCPSVCLSYAGIVPRRKEIGAWGFHQKIPRVSSFWTPNFVPLAEGFPPFPHTYPFKKYDFQHGIIIIFINVQD
jgi:hypothetical protein